MARIRWFTRPLFPAVLLLTTATVSFASPTHSHALVKVAPIVKLGKVLATDRGYALYHWTREKPGHIACTGSCATAWPPLLVPKGANAPKKVAGFSGTFSIVMRPDGKHQLAYNHQALYTYQGDTKPGEALCQAIEGWYVIPAT